MDQPSIGIMANRLSNQRSEMSYFKNLIAEGKRAGGNVFLFSPQDVLPGQRKIIGFVPTPSGMWKGHRAPWPDIVIDRNRSAANPAFVTLRHKKLFPFANSTYTYKWKATELFSKTEKLKHWIPKTVLYSPKELKSMLKQFPILYIKPVNGTGGSSVVKLTNSKGLFTILGRERRSKLRKESFSSIEGLIHWLNLWVQTQNIRSGGFMIQQGLDLELIPERIVDARLLIQKDGEGEWRVTGVALRVGGKNSPTSNIIHKGGKVLVFDQFMTERFGEEKAKEIHKECETLSLEVVRTIEQTYGSMLEFGMDIGIDVNGQVWLIEANQKPSRTVFLKTGEVEIYNKAIQRTIDYVMYLVKKAKDEQEGTKELSVAATSVLPESSPELIESNSEENGVSVELVIEKESAEKESAEIIG